MNVGAKAEKLNNSDFWDLRDLNVIILMVGAGKAAPKMKQYTTEFKKMACEYLYSHNMTTHDVAKNLDIPIKTYEKWISNYRNDRNIYNEDYETLEQENKRLRYTVKRLRETIDILKKAKAFSLLTGEKY